MHTHLVFRPEYCDLGSIQDESPEVLQILEPPTLIAMCKHFFSTGCIAIGGLPFLTVLSYSVSQKSIWTGQPRSDLQSPIFKEIAESAWGVAESARGVAESSRGVAAIRECACSVVCSELSPNHLQKPIENQ